MPSYSANGLPLMEVRLTLPRRGVWVVDAITTTSNAETLLAASSATVLVGDFTLTGTVVRGGVVRASNQVRVIGGAGGLAQSCAPQGWLGASLQTIATTLLNGVGEQLSATSQTALLASIQPRWMTRSEPAAKALSRVVDAIGATGATWRVLPDGTIWIGVDSFPAATLTDANLMNAHPERGEELWGLTSPALLPGTTLNGPVSLVEYHVFSDAEENTKARMRVVYEDAGATDPLDRVLAPIRDLVESFTAELDFLALYPCKVVQQQPDHTLDIQPEDARLPGMQSVPAKFGIPNTTATFLPGARVYLAFEGANPNAPIICGYDPLVATASGLVMFNGTQAVARVGDTVSLDPSPTSAWNAWLTGLAAAATYATKLPTVPLASIDSNTAALKVGP